MYGEVGGTGGFGSDERRTEAWLESGGSNIPDTDAQAVYPQQHELDHILHDAGESSVHWARTINHESWTRSINSESIAYSSSQGVGSSVVEAKGLLERNSSLYPCLLTTDELQSSSLSPFVHQLSGAQPQATLACGTASVSSQGDRRCPPQQQLFNDGARMYECELSLVVDLLLLLQW